MPYEVVYPVAFRAGGDTTRDAFGKHIQEIARIYGILNELKSGKLDSSTLTETMRGHIESSNPHPNYHPPVPSMNDVTGNLAASRVYGDLTNATISRSRVTGLEGYVQGLIPPSSGDGITDALQKESGYVEFKNGLILQWGVSLDGTSREESLTVKFPKEFPNECFVVILTGYYGDITNIDRTTTNFYAHLQSQGKTGFEYVNWVMHTDFYGGIYRGKYHVKYLAIGR